MTLVPELGVGFSMHVCDVDEGSAIENSVNAQADYPEKKSDEVRIASRAMKVPFDECWNEQAAEAEQEDPRTAVKETFRQDTQKNNARDGDEVKAVEHGEHRPPLTEQSVKDRTDNEDAEAGD